MKGLFPGSQAVGLGEAIAPVSEEEEVAPAVWERPASIDDVLRNVIYLYPKHTHTALRYNALYTKQAY